MTGWFEYVFMYIGSSFGFLKGLCVSLFRYRVTSKKLSFMVCISVVIFSPNSSKRFTSLVFILLGLVSGILLCAQVRHLYIYHILFQEYWFYVEGVCKDLLCR